jgi:hypothetical protein
MFYMLILKSIYQNVQIRTIYFNVEQSVEKLKRGFAIYVRKKFLFVYPLWKEKDQV